MDFNEGPREIEYKGYKIGYVGRFNLIAIHGIPSETFTSFAKAQEWIDNPANAKLTPAAIEIKNKSKSKAA